MILFLISLLLFQDPKMINIPFHAGNIRETKNNYVVIHYDSGSSVLSTIQYLKKKRNAYHYIIDKSGNIYKLIDPKYEARHAGLSYFDGHFHINEFSIGICLQNSGKSPYTDNQYTSLEWLLNTLKQKYPDITKEKIVGHSEVAIPFGRKQDPGKYFDWNRLYNSLNWE